MATKSDCVCKVVPIGNDMGWTTEYNPKCLWHKGPDKGYGYDSWGRPNSKHSEKVGTIGAIVVLVAAVSVVIFLIYSALGYFG